MRPLALDCVQARRGGAVFADDRHCGHAIDDHAGRRCQQAQAGVGGECHALLPCGTDVELRHHRGGVAAVDQVKALAGHGGARDVAQRRPATGVCEVAGAEKLFEQLVCGSAGALERLAVVSRRSVAGATQTVEHERDPDGMRLGDDALHAAGLQPRTGTHHRRQAPFARACTALEQLGAGFHAGCVGLCQTGDKFTGDVIAAQAAGLLRVEAGLEGLQARTLGIGGAGARAVAAESPAVKLARQHVHGAVCFGGDVAAAQRAAQLERFA